jgi:gluconate 2-dehydrogenase alpha chain
MALSTVINDPEVDVAVLGLGVTGGIVAAELSTKGHTVIGIEKGPYWQHADDFAPVKYDEWGVGFLHKFDHPLRISTFTMRNTTTQFANPIRRYTPLGQITPMGHGVGGMAQHYAGAMGRYGPWAFEMASSTASRYGPNFLSTNVPTNDVEDWPMTYAQYEPFYVEYEKAFGLTGINQGPLVPMSQNYPLAPHPATALAKLFQSSTEALGYNPYPNVTSLASQAYMNQYGVQVNACIYDGWCAGFCNYQCETGAKANSAYRTVPAAIASNNFTLAVNSYAFRINLNSTTGLAESVSYYDGAGNIHVQPAKVIYNGLWGFNEIRMFALSSIGTQYNPSKVTGSLGRGSTDAGGSAAQPTVSGTVNIGGNAYPSGNASGGAYAMYDLADDNYDHTGKNYIGGWGDPAEIGYGGYVGGLSNGPSNVTILAGGVSATAAGSGYKAALKNFYLPTSQPVSMTPSAPELPDTRWNVDLDPHYNDMYGDPLARITMDWTANPYNGAVDLLPTAKTILQKMNASNITTNMGVPPGTLHLESFEPHHRGGMRIGTNSSTSVMNLYNQVWGVQNVFAGGEIANTTGDNVTAGTHVAGMTAYVAAEGIMKYLSSPGPLA